MNLTGTDRLERLSVGRVSANLLDCLGGRLVLGRNFTVEEEELGNHRVVILSHRMWKQRFAGDLEIEGRTLRLNDEPHIVIGVLPPKFDLRLTGRSTDLWIPIAMTPEERHRGRRGIRIIARLAAGVSPEEAGEELKGIAEGFHAEFPQLYPVESGWGLWLAPLKGELLGEKLAPALWMLQGAVLLVLLIACANVANLFLARATARHKEVALRSALGAGRLELWLDLLIESLLLSLVSAAVGLLLAHWALRLLVQWQGSTIHRLDDARVDVRLFVFTLAVALVTGALCSAVPLLRVLRFDLREALNEAGRVLGAASGGRFLRQAPVVAEVAVSLVVVVVAGLLSRSLSQLQAVDPGFRPDHLLTARLFISPTQYPEDAQQAIYARRLVEAVRARPWVSEVGAISSLPLGQLRIRVGMQVEGLEIPEGQAQPTADWRPIEPDYFKAMGISLREGRLFAATDTADSAAVAIVAERLAKRDWPGQSAIGKRLKVPGLGAGGEGWLTIVGVVGHVRMSGLETEALEQLYTPFIQHPLPFLSFAVRTSAAPENLIPELRQAVWSVAPDQPLSDVQTMEEILADSLADRRTAAFLMSALGIIGLMLAILGVYGVMSYTVALSHQEYSIRKAMGARSEDIFRLVLRRGMTVVALGLVLGLAGAWAVTRVVATMLYGISPLDRPTFLTASLILVAAALMVNAVTARRAAQVDIVEALRVS
ncbi:MAG: ABC transporter permease [bacterium]|nr:ABC transporter permease [bacterium]